MSVKNLKATYIFSIPLHNGLAKNNVFKINKTSFTIYKKQPYQIHITGIKSKKLLEYYRKILEKKYNQCVQNVRIDNLFFTRRQRKNIDMCKLYYHMKSNKKYFPHYNLETFSGMYIQPNNKFYPTIILFRTGIFTLMGGKSFDAINESDLFVCNLTKMFQK